MEDEAKTVPSDPQGFYHPDRGYWQTSDEPSPEILATYPEGTIRYPLKPGDFYEPKDGGWVYVGPVEEPMPPMIIVVYAVHFWQRLDDDEAGLVDGAMKEQSFRMRKIFESANTFRSDSELWPLLNQLAVQLFGQERADQILAPSELEPIPQN